MNIRLSSPESHPKSQFLAMIRQVIQRGAEHSTDDLTVFLMMIWKRDALFKYMDLKQSK